MPNEIHDQILNIPCSDERSYLMVLKGGFTAAKGYFTVHKSSKFVRSSFAVHLSKEELTSLSKQWLAYVEAERVKEVEAAHKKWFTWTRKAYKKAISQF